MFGLLKVFGERNNVEGKIERKLELVIKKLVLILFLKKVMSYFFIMLYILLVR